MIDVAQGSELKVSRVLGHLSLANEERMRGNTKKMIQRERQTSNSKNQKIVD